MSRLEKIPTKLLLALVFILLASIIFLLRINQKKVNTVSAWWDETWTYRQAIDIGWTGSDLTDFQVSFDIGTSALINAGKMQTDCDDIRITDSSGNLLAHWIEEGNPGCNSPLGDTKIWTKLPSLPSTGSTIYIYYGNSSAVNVENGNNVFEFFDDFNDNSIDTNKWFVDDGSSPISTTETNQVLNKSGSYPGATDYHYNTLRSVNQFNNFRVTELKIRINTCTSSEMLLGFKSSVGGFDLRKTSTTNKWQYFSGGWIDIANSSISAGSTFVDTKIIHESTGISVYENDNYLAKKTETINTGSSYLYLPTRIYLSSGASCSVDIDNARLRQYASSDPSATPQSEEVTPGPIAWWKFDEGVGSTAYDSAGNNHGAITGATWQTEDFCISNKCLLFNGTNTLINFDNSPFLRPEDKFTFSTWINTNTTTGSLDGIMGNLISHDGNYYGVSLSISNDDIRLFAGTGSGSYNNKYWNDIISPNHWHYIALVYDNGTFKCYLDGQQLSTTWNTTVAYYSSNFVIGKWAYTYNDYYFNGFIDEVKIYPYARTADQINSDYAAGLAGMGGNSSINIGGDSSGKSLSDGLVGYWTMDEGVGTSIVDKSGNGNTGVFGTGDSAPAWSSGKYGVGISFDGNNDYAYVSTNDKLNFTEAQSFTLSVWVNKSNNDTYNFFIQKQGGTSPGGQTVMYQMDLRQTTGRVYFQMRGNGSDNKTEGGTSSDIGQGWHNIIAVRDTVTDKIFIYVDGILQAEINDITEGDINPTGDLLIGKGGPYFFDGSIDEVRIYNRALSASEVATLYNYAPGPVMHLKMDENQGTTAFDSSGNSNNGTLVSSPVWSAGKFGSALNFDGSDDALTTSLDFQSSQEITYNTWFKWNGQVGTNGFTALFSHINNYNTLRIHSSNGTTARFSCFWDSTSSTQYDSNYPINKDTWYYATIIKTPSKLSFYLNGQLEWEPTVYDEDIVDIAIGRQTGSDRNWNGLLDDVRIYNYARTPKQILEDMNARSGASKSTLPIAYWSFDEGYGTTAKDSVGSNHATINGSTWTSNGKSGKALLFDGADLVASNLDYNNNNYSISAHIYPTATGDYKIIAGSSIGNNVNDGLVLVNNNICFHEYSTQSQDVNICDTSNLISLNTWHHVVLTYNNGTINLYHDGKVAHTDSYTTSNSSTSTIIGGNTSMLESRVFDGLIDEVKIYNYALSADEVKQDYNQGFSAVMGQSSSNTGSTAAPGSASQEYCIPGDTSPCSPPVAEWNFDEGVGTTAFDISGNNNHGVFGSGSSAPSWTMGKTGNAISFDGTDDIIDNTDLTLTGPFTYSFWINSFDTGTRMWSSGTSSQKFGTVGGNFFVRVISSSDNTIVFPSTNSWHHIVLSRDSSNKVDLYTDGGSPTRLFSDAAQSGTTYLQIIGRANDGSGQHFQGKIDQIRIYDYARTPAQIAWDYNRGKPVAHWKMDECQGTTIHSSNDPYNPSLDGTLSVNASGTQTTAGTCDIGGTSAAWYNGAAGKTNASLNFDGSDDYIDLGNQDLLKMKASFSISSWIKTTYKSNQTFILSKAKTDIYNISWVNGFNLVIRPTTGFARFIVRGDSDSPTAPLGTTDVANGQWHQIIGVYDAENKLTKIFVDGRQEDAKTTPDYSSGNPTQNNYSLEVGRNINADSSPTNYFSGQIDDVQIYNYALTGDQIKTLYNSGAVSFN